MCYENFKASQVTEGAGSNYTIAQKSKFTSATSTATGTENEPQAGATRSSLTLQISDDVFHNASNMQMSSPDIYLTAPLTSLSLRLHS